MLYSNDARNIKVSAGAIFIGSGSFTIIMGGATKKAVEVEK